MYWVAKMSVTGSCNSITYLCLGHESTSTIGLLLTSAKSYAPKFGSHKHELINCVTNECKVFRWSLNTKKKVCLERPHVCLARLQKVGPFVRPTFPDVL